ncbi:MAG: hypothetical protein K2O24_05660, partial [Muribaculaceae bacterium]|nr:hypothetical protein [Muribaculaceae bacterium]
DTPSPADFNPFPTPLPPGSVTMMPHDAPKSPASSTAVRGALSSGQISSGMLAPQVAAYIRRHRLYRNS